ncbi:PIG-L family deacetylase [Sulfurimonas sp.]|uniref:PIG-L family deacetylase n=1 Tax=Sulfurimonas sp. TaxID=2022749 RepID=UPI0025DC54E6|nr:PIG-L family deacetylase [Sulfurimonas sp.]
MIYFYLLLTLLFFYLFLLSYRVKKYKYNQRDNYIYNLNRNIIDTLEIKNNSLTLSKDIEDYDSLFLKIEIYRNLLSYIFKPYIEIEDIKHYFEYGAKGIRYLNISHVKSKTLKVNIYNVKIKNKGLSLFGYKNSIDLSQKTLILAPHADDAEIASFGFYKTAKNVTIVTTTIGENGACNYCSLYSNDRTKNSLKKAQLRTMDALSIGFLGNVDIRNSITLGYFGGSLKSMFETPNKKVCSHIKNFTNMNSFRNVSHSNIKLPLYVESTYASILNDLKEILIQTKPKNIITPHPTIDSHSDHKYTTKILIQALKETDVSCKLLLYTNHLELSETYPIGEIHSSISIPPNIKEFYFDSIYSFGLDKETQIDKFFALEASHDLRDSLVFLFIKKAYKHLSRMIRRKLTAKERNYYKRAIRANELFFVVENKNIDKLI